MSGNMLRSLRPLPASTAVLAVLAAGMGPLVSAVAHQRPAVPAGPLILSGPSARSAKAAPPPPGTPGSAAAPAGAPTSASASQNQAGLEMDDWEHDEKTNTDIGHNFIYSEGDTTITGRNARYNNKSKVLDADGNLALDDPKHHVTGGKAHVDNSKTKLAVLTENIVIVLKPAPKNPPPAAPASPAPAVKPAGDSSPPPAPASTNAPQGDKAVGDDSQDASQERGQGGTITCDQVDDFYKKQFMVLKGHLVFRQHLAKAKGGGVDRTLTAEHAEYDGKTEKLLLYAPVEAHDSDGRQMQFKGNVTVGTKEGEEWISTKEHVKATFPIDEDADNESGDGKSAPTPPAPAGGGKEKGAPKK